MQSGIIITLLALFLATSAHGAQQKSLVSPIEKVIEMIGDLEQKTIKEGEASQKTYGEFTEWCEEESRNLGFEMKGGKSEAEELSATIQKAEADIADEEEIIGKLTSQISTDEADLKAATAIRKKEQGAFQAEEQELMASVDTLTRAVGILERELGGGASLAQIKIQPGVLDALKAIINLAKIDNGDHKKLAALLQIEHKSQVSSEDAEEQREDDMMSTLGAPDPAAFESNAGGIVDTINELLEDAKTELSESRKKEKKNKHNYDLLKLELTDAINFANKELDAAKKAKAEAAETKSVAEGDMAVVQKELSVQIAELNGVHHDCMTKAEEFELEMQDRGAELKALAEAKKIIIEATGGSMVQAYAGAETSFLQIGSSNHNVLDANQNAIHVVKNLAYKLKSTVLAQLATRMQAAARFYARYGAQAGDDPFAKIKGLIQDMIAKLMKEAEEEASAKGYCDKEMSETKQKKDELSDEIEKLTAKIDEWTAQSKKLKEEVATLQKELADLEKSQAEMDKIRDEENSEYNTNKAEMEQGLDGIKLALKVLREYYGKGGADGGIIAMLEVIEADFTKTLEEMITAEEEAVKEYEALTQDNAVAKTTKTQDVKYKTGEAKALDASIAESTSDRTGLETELNAVLDYYESVKKQCIAKPESYEERKKRREAEIAGLKEALEILEGAAVFLQPGQSLRGVHRHKK